MDASLSQACLQDIDKEVMMANKMTDLAVCGCIVTTPEVHEAAKEKFGIMSKWRGIYMTYDMLKLVWTNDAMVKRTLDVFNNYSLDANKFETSHDLYSILNKKYGELFLVSHHIQTSLLNSTSTHQSMCLA